MTGVVHASYTDGNRLAWEHLTDATFRWFLPAAASLALLLGGAILLLSRSTVTRPDTSLGLFLTGWGASAVLVALFCRVQFQGSLRKAETTAVPVTSTPVVSSSRPTQLETLHRPVPTLSSRGSEWRVLAAPTSPGDETWLSWLPRESRQLGVGIARIGRGAVYSPGGSGSLVAFPTRKESSGARPVTMAGDFAQSTSRTPPSRDIPRDSAKRSTFSEEDLDRMFPPLACGRTLFLSDVPDKIGLPRAPSKRSGPSVEIRSASTESAALSDDPVTPRAVDPVDHSRGALHDGDSVDTPLLSGSPSPSLAGIPVDLQGPLDPADELFREATNPVPPHLRGVGLQARVGAHRPERNRRDTANPKSVCASCSKVVVALRMSGPCPKCLRPICNECLREAFVTHGQGWCIDCSSTPVVSAS